jgi:hypothetical protein
MVEGPDSDSIVWLLVPLPLDDDDSANAHPCL